MEQYRVQIQTRTKGYGNYGIYPITGWMDGQLDLDQLNCNPELYMILEDNRINYPKFAIGNKFVSKWSGEEYILASVGRANEVILISMYDGLRVSVNPVVVEDINSISQEEFNKLTNGDKFERKEK